MKEFLSNIFSMRYDLIIPLSSCLVAIMLAGALFCIRYFSYKHKKRKYEKIAKQSEDITALDNETKKPQEQVIDT